MNPCHVSSRYSGSAMRADSAPSESKRQSSTFVAFAEKTAKLTPWPCQVAPRGNGDPSRTAASMRMSGAFMAAPGRVRGARPAAGRPALTRPHADVSTLRRRLEDPQLHRHRFGAIPHEDMAVVDGDLQ